MKIIKLSGESSRGWWNQLKKTLKQLKENFKSATGKIKSWGTHKTVQATQATETSMKLQMNKQIQNIQIKN